MDERVVQFRIGVMVLATIIIAGILVLLFGELPAMVRGAYTVQIRFSEAPGVAQDTPVRKSGVLIGRVKKVEFQEGGEGVLVTVELNPDVQVHRAEKPVIRTSLLGDAELQFVQAEGEPPGAPRIPLQEGDVLEGRTAPDPLRVLADMQDDFEGAIKSLSGAGDDVSNLARNLDKLLGENDEQITRIVGKTERALESFQSAMNDIEELIGDENLKNDLRRSVAELPNILRQTGEAVAGVKTTVDLASANLRNLEGVTRPLADRGDDMIAKIDSSVTRLDELLTQMALFSRSLNSREGSLGQLVNNPDLYQELNEAAANINDITRELQPIINDARVFADKIARHPELLGARGAIAPSSGIK